MSQHVPGVAQPPITKSQFKLGLDCIQKLRHAREGLPRTTDDNDMLRLLSEGGAAIEALQRAKEPPRFAGDIGRDAAAEESRRQIDAALRDSRSGGGLQSLYEVTIEADGFLARIDLLRVHVDRLELVEIKAKSRPERGFLREDGDVYASWLPYVQDIAFQRELLSRWLVLHREFLGITSDMPVSARLLLVEPSGRAKSGDILAPSNFRSTYRYGGRSVRASVEFVGPTPLADTELICELSIDDAVAAVRRDAGSDVAQFNGLGIVDCMASMKAMVDRDEWPDSRGSLGTSCKKCEFRVEPPRESGFARCWGDAVLPMHHVLELASVRPTQFEAAAEAAGPMARVTDVPVSMVCDSQRPQWTSIASERPIVDPAFAADPLAMLVPSGWEGPVNFLDFECSSYPVPSRIGGSPYELVPFQFEGHRLPSARAALTDRRRLEGILLLAEPDPRRGFVDALRAQFAEPGPIFHWHHYERTVLAGIRASLAADDGPGDADRIGFIDSLTGSSSVGQGRLVDLLPIARGAFYHPELRGSYSIKRVVPIAWSEPAIRAAFGPNHGAIGDPEAYAADDDPYDALPLPPESILDAVGGAAVVRRVIDADDDGSGGQASGIRNGGMAMLAYHHVRMFGGHDQPEVVAQFRRYCRLDSAAMVMVFALMRDVVGKWGRATA